MVRTNLYSEIFLVQEKRKISVKRRYSYLVWEGQIQKLPAIGLDTTKFWLHSFRSGGATCAHVAGMSDTSIKLHERWKTDTSKDLYIKENVAQKKHISLHLGI